MEYRSEKTTRGNIGFSWFSQEAADAQAREMDERGNENCLNCSDCSDCSGCSYCSRCSGCSGCSDCSRCSGCSGCSDCSHIAFLEDKKGLAGDPEAAGAGGAPAIPVIENIHQKVLEAVSKPDALNMITWHICETTHCRAGWVVHLAGEAGRKLEAFHDTPLAALLIYHASSPDLPKISPTRFYETNEVAMADIQRMADLEKQMENKNV